MTLTKAVSEPNHYAVDTPRKKMLINLLSNIINILTLSLHKRVTIYLLFNRLGFRYAVICNISYCIFSVFDIAISQGIKNTLSAGLR
jgi:hypothetical protein